MIVLRRILFISLVFVLLASCAPKKNLPASTPLRGAWVQGKSVLTKEEIDSVIRKAEQGGFKEIFVGVFGEGRTLYPSAVAEQKIGVEPGFDPLAYIVEQAHQKGIQVHAWFAVGRVADAEGNSVVIEQHPDWGLVGPEGQTMAWLNFSHPEARKFITDIMMEAVARGVDGLHFDYTRYPDSEWGFDDYSISAFNAGHDFDLNELRYAALPAYGQFEGNGLLQPLTAQVLARFSNGIPAVLLNQHGNGQALILNWKAAQRKTAVGSEILNRGIQTFLQEGGEVYILRSETTLAEYSDEGFNSTVEWLDSLGWDFTEVSAAEMGELAPGSVLVLPYVYLFSDTEAQSLARFVSNGGNAIFIDGPTPSMDLEDMRAVTGMLPLRKYFRDWLLMTASENHPLLPVSGRPDDLRLYEKRNEEWTAFRAAGINSLIEEVNQRVKEANPNVLVTVTITSDKAKARQEVLQDWQTWLDEGMIDALIPRAYEDAPAELSVTLDEWSPVMDTHDRLTYGLIVYAESDDEAISKTPAQLMEEIRMVKASGSNGFMIFDLDRLNKAQLDLLANIEP
ncbi:MAG TPA: family 10 glycosylhydrolase [Anaerolineales bacterium]|nr:family 10 glycosylhydrolase [Anaerolineales bacterium]